MHIVRFSYLGKGHTFAQHKGWFIFSMLVRLAWADWPRAFLCICILIWVHLRTKATVERTSGSDEAETDGREATINHSGTTRDANTCPWITTDDRQCRSFVECCVNLKGIVSQHYSVVCMADRFRYIHIGTNKDATYFFWMLKIQLIYSTVKHLFAQ